MPVRPAAQVVTQMTHTLAVDALTAGVVAALRAAGCRAIVLKGPAFRHHLYSDRAPRTYADVDLLVAPSELRRSGEALTKLGFEMRFDHLAHPGVAEPHAQEWGRPGEPRLLDLHWRVAGVEAAPERAWEILRECTEPIVIAREQVDALRPEGIALLASLHASHHGRTQERPLVDLERAVARLGLETWTRAAGLAADLEATEAFAAGLGLIPAGGRLASTLVLPEVRSAQRRLLAGDPPGGAIGLLRMTERAPLRARLRTLRHALVPAPSYMRATSALASRGGRWLPLAYLARAGRRTLQLPAAARAVRESRSDQPPPPSLFRLVLGSVRLAWSAGRRELTVMTAAFAVSVVAVTVGLLLTRSLLAALLLANDAGRGPGTLSGRVVGVVASIAVVAVAGAVQLQNQRLLTELCARRGEDELLAVTSAVDLGEFDRPGFHDDVERALMGVRRLPTVITGLAGLVRALAGALGALVALAAIQPTFAAAMLVVALPTTLAARRRARLSHEFARRMTPSDRQRHYLAGVLTDREAAKEVRAFELPPFVAARRERLWDERLRELRGNVKSQLRFSIAADVAASALVGAALLALISLTLSDKISLASGGVTAAAIILLGQRLAAAAANAGTLSESTSFMHDYMTLAERYQGRVWPDAGEDPEPPAAVNVRADSVGFAYPGGREPVLHDISLEIAQGQVVALVGENGSGKTTLAKLLGGLLEPTAGRVTWNGADATSDAGRRLRAGVGVIFQDFGRYALSASDNIGIGRHARLPDEAGVKRAAAAAGIDEELANMPAGYETTLGPAFAGGTDLSIGQWQRVALARMLFRDAPFVILDEPTAALDAQAEHELFAGIREILAGRGVLLISHRFSTVRAADRIHVLAKGAIVESGTHDELIARGGRYAELFRLQADPYRE